MSNTYWKADTIDSGPTIRYDLMNMFVGELIGSGAYRNVYASARKRSEVIKIEQGSRCFSNIRENDLWWNVINRDDLNKWFAPVVDISPAGTVLIMKRTMPVAMSEMPKKIPNFFSDLKIENWGRYKGRIVCHDYGNTLALGKGTNNWKMKKAEWWSEND